MDALAFESRGDALFKLSRRAAAAGDAGHRARLGNRFLQVPLPSSPRAQPL
jgi:hypothetical protein